MPPAMQGSWIPMHGLNCSQIRHPKTGWGRERSTLASWAGGWASALDGGRGVTTSVPCWETVQAFAMTPKAADEEFSKGSEPCCPSWAPHA